MIHKIQDFTGALELYVNTLMDYYGELYDNLGSELETLGFPIDRQSMRIEGMMYGLKRAQAIIEGSASALTSRY